MSLTIREAIDHLGKYPDDHLMRPGWSRVDSWQGHYNELAVTLANQPNTVSYAKAILERAIGGTFAGYKGGRYVMNEDTPVHVAQWGTEGEPLTMEYLEKVLNTPPPTAEEMLYDLISQLQRDDETVPLDMRNWFTEQNEKKVVDYQFLVTVSTAEEEDAKQVMCERIDVVEDYGFPYKVNWVEYKRPKR